MFPMRSSRLIDSLSNIGLTPNRFKQRSDVFSRRGHASENGKAVLLNADAPVSQFGAKSFDVITCFHVLEHVSDWDSVIGEISRVLRSGGVLFFDTINRTPWSWFTAVFGLERVLRMVPRGTHDWRLFIRPAELDRLLRGAGLEPVTVCGLAPRIGPGVVVRGLLTRRIDVPTFATGDGRRASYLGHYRKAAAA